MGIEQAQGIFTVEGHLSVAALLASTYSVRSILVTDAHAARYADVDIPVYSLPSGEIEQLTGVHFHRGVLAAADRPTLPSPGELAALRAPDPGPRGCQRPREHRRALRNAAAFGADAVVLDPTAADPLYRRATRVSLGHVLRVPFARATDWPAALDDLRIQGFTLVGLSPDADESLADLVATAPERIALLLGAEGNGLSAAALGAVDRRIRIPMAPGVDSINVATAAAIALAALFRPQQ